MPKCYSCLEHLSFILLREASWLILVLSFAPTQHRGAQSLCRAVVYSTSSQNQQQLKERRYFPKRHFADHFLYMRIQIAKHVLFRKHSILFSWYSANLMIPFSFWHTSALQYFVCIGEVSPQDSGCSFKLICFSAILYKVVIFFFVATRFIFWLKH